MTEHPVPPDPLVDEVRRIRNEISARFDHDPARLVRHYMELDKQYRDRLLTPPEAAANAGKSAA